jgi:hypothetical protein
MSPDGGEAHAQCFQILLQFDVGPHGPFARLLVYGGVLCRATCLQVVEPAKCDRELVLLG